MSTDWNFLQELVFNFGHQLATNPTQYMMEQAFDHHRLNWRYVQFEFSEEKLAAAVQAMRLLGFRGGNCTIPYKVAIIEHLDALGESAALMEAVNCVVLRDGQLVGENTDGKGFLQSFRQVADPSEKRVTLLGAGGAARAIAVELALAGAASISIVNRDVQRGADLAQLISDRTPAAAQFVPWEGEHSVDRQTQVVVNATSVGMDDAEARLPLDYESLRPPMLVADVIVNPPATALLRAADERGCTTLDGLGMVVNQALIAFAYWTGIEADGGVMRDALRRVLQLD